VARIELAAGVLDDFARFLDHMVQYEVPEAPARIGDLMQAIGILRHSPLIGRPVSRGPMSSGPVIRGTRELVVGQGSRGYVALYRHVRAVDTVFVLAIRRQREDGFKRARPDPPQS
jgi:toxin ParE1/3/4